MKNIHVIRVALAALGWVLITLMSGCVSMPESGIPGATSVSVKDDPIPTSVVLLALKAQFADAVAEINRVRSEEPAAFANAFEMKKGTGVFSGSTQVIVAGGVSIAAIVPITGYADSKLKPKIGGSGMATNIQETTLTFEFDPHLSGEDVRQDERLRNVETGTFVTDALVASFNGVAPLIRRPAKSGPTIKLNELKVAVSFSVTRKFDAGLGDTIVLIPAPDLDSLGPTASRSREQTSVYKLQLTIPLVLDTPPDSRRIALLQPLKNGMTLSVEEPYSQNRYEELLHAASVVGKDGEQPVPPKIVDPFLNAVPSELSPSEGKSTKPGSPLGPKLEPRGI